MKLHRLILFLATAILTTTAHAQVGIYGIFDSTHVSTSNSVDPTAWYEGIGAGTYYDFLHFGPVGIGADLRGNLLFGGQQKYRSALFGIRLSVKPPVIPIKPYIQGSVGVGGASQSGFHGGAPTYNNKFQYEIFGGADLTVAPHLDWRVAELGYGRMTGTGSGYPPSADHLFTVDSGLVLRF